MLLAYTDVSGDFYYKNPKEGVQGFPVVPNKSAMHWGKPPKNATWTSAIYRFCFTKFMREMLRSVSKKAIKCTK